MPVKLSRRLAKNGWSLWHAAGALLLAALGVGLTWQGWARLVKVIGERPEAAHIPLVLPIILWLVWVRRKRIQLCAPGRPWFGVGVLAFGAFSYIVGLLTLKVTPLVVGAVFVPGGAVLAVLGWDVVKAYKPAVFLALALVPLPMTLVNWIAPPLQQVSAHLFSLVYSPLGQPVSVGWGVLFFPHGMVPLDEALSTLPMLCALVLVSYGFVFGTPLRTGARLTVLIFCTPILAVICAAGSFALWAWVGGAVASSNVAPWRQVLDWAMFAAAIGLLVMVVKLLSWASVPIRPYTLAYDS